MIRLAALVLALAMSVASAAERSRAERAAFVRTHPCPATGSTRGACPGYQVDHRVPLCAGGPDAPSNMQWLSVPEHKAKTRGDVRACSMRR